MSVLDNIVAQSRFAPPPPQQGIAPMQFALPQNIPAAQPGQPPAQPGQAPTGQMPAGTMDAIMKLFAAGGV